MKQPIILVTLTWNGSLSIMSTTWIWITFSTNKNLHPSNLLPKVPSFATFFPHFKLADPRVESFHLTIAWHLQQDLLAPSSARKTRCWRSTWSRPQNEGHPISYPSRSVGGVTHFTQQRNETMTYNDHFIVALVQMSEIGVDFLPVNSCIFNMEPEQTALKEQKGTSSPRSISNLRCVAVSLNWSHLWEYFWACNSHAPKCDPIGRQNTWRSPAPECASKCVAVPVANAPVG